MERKALMPLDYIQHYDSPLGGMTMASDGFALTGLWFDGQKFFAETLAADHISKPLPVFNATAQWLDLYFSGKKPTFTPLLNMRTTPFRRAVWRVMLTIPFSKTMTYGEIAIVVANGRGRMSAQAVGNAVGHNAISLIIPCHRVIGAGGKLTGYGGGLWRKQRLLELESITN